MYLQGGHKPGILRDFSDHGQLGEFCATSGINCNKQSTFSSSFKYLCKTAVSSTSAAGSHLMKVIFTFTFCCDNLWKSKLWKSLENSGNFSLLLCGHPDFFAIKYSMCVKKVLSG